MKNARNQRTEEKQTFFPDKKTATQFSLEFQRNFLGAEKSADFSCVVWGTGTSGGFKLF